MMDSVRTTFDRARVGKRSQGCAGALVVSACTGELIDGLEAIPVRVFLALPCPTAGCGILFHRGPGLSSECAGGVARTTSPVLLLRQSDSISPYPAGNSA